MTAAIDQPCRYTIEVEGQLSPHWLEFFSPLNPKVEAGQGGASCITLCGPFSDQSALNGVLQSLYNLGCVLVSVRRET